jgi:hypothetical protein
MWLAVRMHPSLNVLRFRIVATAQGAVLTTSATEARQTARIGPESVPTLTWNIASFAAES